MFALALRWCAYLALFHQILHRSKVSAEISRGVSLIGCFSFVSVYTCVFPTGVNVKSILYTTAGSALCLSFTAMISPKKLSPYPREDYHDLPKEILPTLTSAGKG